MKNIGKERRKKMKREGGWIAKWNRLRRERKGEEKKKEGKGMKSKKRKAKGLNKLKGKVDG